MRHRFKIRGREVVLRFVRLFSIFGDCSGPYHESPEIRIDDQLKPRKELEIVIHEMLHCVFWDLDEKVIATVSRDMAKVLWHVGFRK